MKPRLKFFIDNCLPNRLAVAINLLDRANEVRHLQRKFDPATEDVYWIQALSKEGGWIIVTSDLLYRGAAEKAALEQSGIPVCFLKSGWSKLPLWEQASKLMHWRPRILDQASRIKPGHYFSVPVSGSKIESGRIASA